MIFLCPTFNYTLSISFALGERVEAEKKIELAEKLLKKLDFKNVPYLVVEHFDKEYEHFHIIAGRIRDDGSTVKEWKIAERAIDATKELEKTLGLRRTKYTKSGDRRIKVGEYKQMERTGELSVMAEAKLTIDEILKDEPNVKDFVESLQQSGFEVKPNISEKTGKMNGFSFKKGAIKFKSSAIAKNYSWQNLRKNGLKYDQKRDAEFLVGVKNEFTQKLNLESGRNQGTETPKSIINSAESITDRAKSISGKGIRPEIAHLKNRTVGHPNLSGESEFSEMHKSSAPVAFTEKSDGTEISAEAVSENGHRESYRKNRANTREYSEIGKSKDSFSALDITLSAPELIPAPKREPEKKESRGDEKDRFWEKSR